MTQFWQDSYLVGLAVTPSVPFSPSWQSLAVEDKEHFTKQANSPWPVSTHVPVSFLAISHRWYIQEKSISVSMACPIVPHSSTQCSWYTLSRVGENNLRSLSCSDMKFIVPSPKHSTKTQSFNKRPSKLWTISSESITLSKDSNTNRAKTSISHSL